MTVVDKTDSVLNKFGNVKDRALAQAAFDIDTIVKTGGRTPFGKTGNLRDRTRTEKISNEHYRVVIPVSYAAYQERGSRIDGSYVVKHYTTPGTGKGFLNAAVHTVAGYFDRLVKQASQLEGF